MLTKFQKPALHILIAIFVFLGQSFVLAGPPYPTFPMNEKYEGETEPWGWAYSDFKTPVQYVTAAEAENYRLTFRDGKVYDHEGKLFDTRGWSGIYVMTSNGDFYATTEQRAGLFHHSSLVRGLPVAGAGDLIVREGVIERINNRSGHYQPPRNAMDNVVEQLRNNGVEPQMIDYIERPASPESPEIPKVVERGSNGCKSLLAKLKPFSVGR